jgi:hypothetical protein
MGWITTKRVCAAKVRAVIRTVGDKMVARKGERVTWRILPARLSRVVVAYLVVVLPFRRALEIYASTDNKEMSSCSQRG